MTNSFHWWSMSRSIHMFTLKISSFFALNFLLPLAKYSWNLFSNVDADDGWWLWEWNLVWGTEYWGRFPYYQPIGCCCSYEQLWDPVFWSKLASSTACGSTHGLDFATVRGRLVLIQIQITSHMCFSVPQCLPYIHQLMNLKLLLFW